MPELPPLFSALNNASVIALFIAPHGTGFYTLFTALNNALTQAMKKMNTKKGKHQWDIK